MAALVEELKADGTVVNLVNLSVIETHRHIIQAGAFGEHTFTAFSYDREKRNNHEKEAVKVVVNKPYFVVELPPSAS